MATVDRKSLLKLLDRKLSAEEVATLIFELGLDEANLEGDIKRAHLRSLIEHFEQREEMDRLLAAVASLRPDVLAPNTTYTMTAFEASMPSWQYVSQRGWLLVGLAIVVIVAATWVGAQWYMARSSNTGLTIDELTDQIAGQPNNASLYFDRGELYRWKGDYRFAIDDYTEAVTLRPDFPEAYHSLGISYATIGDTAPALENYTKSIELRRNAWAFLNRGELYLSLGEYDLAIADFSDAVKLQADFSQAYFARGLAYLRKKDNARAIADFEKVIDLNNDSYWRGQAEEQLRSLR